MNIKWSVNMFKQHVGFSFRIAQKRDIMHEGVGNRCADGTYVPFLDYDNTPIEWIYDEVKLVQDIFGLGNGYIFRTKHGHHVVFLDKMILGEVVQVLECTTVDTNYKKIPMMYGRRAWVLRHTNKSKEEIKYIGLVISEDCEDRERSNAHKLWLKRRYNVPDIHFDLGGWDDSIQLVKAFYPVPKESN